MLSCLVLVLQSMIWTTSLPYITGNSFAPEISSVNINERIPENTKFGVTVATVTASDRDTQFPDNDIRYQMYASQLASDYFAVDILTGNIFVKRDLTLDTSTIYQVYVQAYDMGSPSRSSATNATVMITVYRNLHDPFFAGESFSIIISENIVTSASILQVSFGDRDTDAPFNTVTVSVIGDDKARNYFRLESNGRIMVNSDLKADSDTQYLMRILAQDGGSPPRTATTVASITVQRNLNSPVFERQSYNETILETRQLGLSFLQVKATDGDARAPYNEVRYFIASDAGSNLGAEYFMMDEITGNISLRRSPTLDKAKTAKYTFSVLARDNGNPARFSVNTSTVTITVFRNLLPPIFHGEPYIASLNFNSPIGSTVQQVNATDADILSPFNTVTYSIIGDVLFSINPATGLITTRQSLQNNNVERSSILIMARDGGTPSLTATSTVSVTIARNLNAPEWIISAYTVNLTETEGLGIPIAVLSTRDNDVVAPFNTRITTLTGDANMMQYFTLSDNGQLSVKRQLTTTNIRTFTGTASLRDGGNPPLTPTGAETATITVYVLKNDHAPYFINEPYFKDLEGNIQQGASVFQVTARDDDRGFFGSVRYKITGDDLAGSYFTIDENSGLISIKNVLSGVNENQFKVRVEAFDVGRPSKTNVSVVTLTVKSNYQRPIFNQQSYFARIPETQNLDQRIIAVTANDSDALAPNNVVRYSLTERADSIDCFLIDAQTGSLCLRRSLLYAPCTSSRYQMTVTATDLGLNPLSNTVVVTVDVDRNANPPIFQNIPAIIPINENQPTGQSFFTVRATDADTVSPFGDVTYSLVGDGTAAVYFQVDSSTGVVSLKQSVQPDTASTYRLTFRATDGGNPPRYDDKILTVNVNRNLLAPEFVQQVYEVTIWEIQALDTVIQEVSARDNDTKAPNNEVTYEIVGDSLAQTYFRVDNEGRVYVRRPLTDDNADTGLYTLSIRANDKGTPQLSSNTLATVRVTVLRNRNCPTFVSSVVDISIDQSHVSRVIYDANATDPDAANTPFSAVRYLLIGDENARVLFRVDEQTGQVSTIEPSLFSDQGTIYQLRVRAEDAVNTVTSCSGTLVLRVTVNRNLNSPQWTNVNTANNYVTTISETHSVSLSVYRIQAVDADDKAPNNVVSYAMTANSPNRNLFFVDLDGFVYLRNSLVGTAGDPFTVRFVATDGGNPVRSSPEATLTVNVNRNQFPPEILNLPAEKEIQENQLVNEEIYRVNGRDNDTVAPFNAYSFELVGDGSSTTFFQVSGGGAVTLRQSISSDPATSFQLRVHVKDGGSPQKQDEGLLTIKVNKNLFSPVMTTGQYSRQILETQTVSMPLVTVQATDSDQFAPNNQLRYYIVGSKTTITDFFMVDEDAGAVMLRRSMLDYPNTATRFTVNFQVNAEDKGSVPRQANNPQLVTISVVRNTAPFFENELTYNAEVQQFAPGGTVVFTPQGRDADTDSPFNVLTYSLIGDDATPTVFQINPNTGTISTRPTTNLTRTTGNFVARVQVTDGGSPPLSDTATVQITVQRNRETPRFLHAVDLTRNIPETLPAGSEIIDLNATDDDFFVPNNVISYVITGGDGNPLEYFFIHPSTGVIGLLKSVKTIATSDFRLTVEARDQGDPMRLATATVHFNVLRDTGVLAFSANNYNVTIGENTPVGSSVTTTVASPGTNIEYFLVGVSSGPYYFNVNSASGQVNVRQRLISDPVRQTIYQLLVKAINWGISTQSATSTVNIYVIRNENGPVFRPSNTYSTTVEDTIPLGFNVTLLSAIDADGDQLNYRILSGSPHTDLFYLNPVTGQITLKNVLQGRAENQYMFQVQVSDQRTPERTANATVIVNVIKDRFAPQFIRTPYFCQTTENTQNGSIIFTTTAIDQDLRGRIQYEIIGNYPAPSFFDVDKYTGVIRILQDLKEDRFATGTYNLFIVAYDSFHPNNKATSEVIINVQRTPATIELSQKIYVVQLLETTPVGNNILQVFPANASENAMYAIESSLPLSGLNIFNLDAVSGIMTTKASLQSGSNYFYQLEVKATDRSNPTRSGRTTVFIIVEDFCCLSNNRTCELNSNAPIFSAPLYFVNVMEGDYSTNNQPLIEVSASDIDFGPDGDLVFEIQSVSNNGDGKFEIQQKPSGRKASIICIGKISRDLTYVIMIRASDQAVSISRKRSSSVPVEIKVVPFRN